VSHLFSICEYKSHFNHLRQEVSLFDALSEKGEAVKVKREQYSLNFGEINIYHFSVSYAQYHLTTQTDI